MIKIPLTQNKFALIDDEDFDLIDQYKWYAHNRKETNIYYATTNIVQNGVRQTLRMHWVIMQTKGIDHINHNGLDNRKANLRICNQSQNIANARKGKIKTSVFKGVYKKGNKYIASIRYKDKRYCLGSYYEETNAALAYDRVAEDFFGEFANLNIPDSKAHPSKEYRKFGPKLNIKDIVKIKKLLKGNDTIKDIAKIFSVSEQTIYNIKNCKTWDHVI